MPTTKSLTSKGLSGGRDRDRTCDPYHVNLVPRWETPVIIEKNLDGVGTFGGDLRVSFTDRGFAGPGRTTLHAPSLPHDVFGAHLLHIAYKLWGMFENGGGYNSRSTLGDVLPLSLPILRGSLRLRIRRVPRCIVLQAGKRVYRDSSGEGAGHKEMKAAAVLWMHSLGATDAREEVSCFVGRADAYSPIRKWAVECGNTSVKKLVSFLCGRRYDPAYRFTIIPYQRNGFDGHVRGLIAIEFEASADALSDLYDYRSEMVQYPCGVLYPDKRAPLSLLASGRVV